MRKFDYVDSLRGLAILSVLMIHVSQYGNFTVPDVVKKIIESGNMGVQLFYLASAFTLFLSFRNRLAKEVSPIRNFFMRRFFRIAPMYYISICYYLIQDGLGPRYWLGDAKEISMLNIFSNFTFLHGFSPYWINSVVPGGWSIGIEMMFYSILPFLYSKIKNINQAFSFLLISMMINVLFQILLNRLALINSNDLWNNYLYFSFPNQLPIFSLGIIMYFIVIEGKDSSQISGKLLLLFSMIFLFQLVTGIKLLLPPHLLSGIGLLILSIGLSRYKFPLFVNPIVTYIGKISFSMYLVHFGVLHWLLKLGFVDYSDNGIINYLTRFAVVLLTTVLMSTLLYQLIEIPFQNFGKRVINTLENRDIYTQHSVAQQTDDTMYK